MGLRAAAAAGGQTARTHSHCSAAGQVALRAARVCVRAIAAWALRLRTSITPCVRVEGAKYARAARGNGSTDALSSERGVFRVLRPSDALSLPARVSLVSRPGAVGARPSGERRGPGGRVRAAGLRVHRGELHPRRGAGAAAATAAEARGGREVRVGERSARRLVLRQLVAALAHAARGLGESCTHELGLHLTQGWNLHRGYSGLTARMAGVSAATCGRRTRAAAPSRTPPAARATVGSARRASA